MEFDDSTVSCHIIYAVLYMNIYTIDIVIALLNTVCFVNISIPKAKCKHICEEFKFVHESIMTLRDL
jgi:hypothetical protein